MEIVVGFQGKEHVTAGQVGRILAGMAGDGAYVLDTQNKLAATMVTANQVRIDTGDLVMHGRVATVETPETLTIQSGVTGQKRNDLVVARYEKQASTSVESCKLVVVRGTAVSYGSPVDPSINEGSILDGDSPVDVPLWRIPIDGLTPGTPVKLFEDTPSISELRDSVSQAPRVYTGTEIVSFSEGSETVQVWSSADVQRLFPGVGDFPYVGFSLGDNNFDSWAILGALQVRSGSGQQGISNGDAIFCQSSRATTGLVRLNYVVAGRP